MQVLGKVRAAVVAALIALPTTSFAQTILTVTTPETSATFSLEELLAMPQTTVITKNDYVDEATTFQGPRLHYVLRKLNVDRAATLEMIALNDFTSHAPATDAFDYDVILALLRDGDLMPIRDKGPIWVIYPMDDNPNLQDDAYNSRLVWQLDRIVVE